MTAAYRHSLKEIESAMSALSYCESDACELAELYCKRAGVHAKQGALRQALADCSTAVDMDSSNAKAYLGRGKLRAKLGDRMHALDDLESAQCLGSLKVTEDGVTDCAVAQEAARCEDAIRKELSSEAAAAEAAKSFKEAMTKEAAFKAAAAKEAAAKAAAKEAEEEAAKAEARKAKREEQQERFRSEFYEKVEAARRAARAARERSNAGFNAGQERHWAESMSSISNPDHYIILGVEPSADADAIRKGYKKMCLKYHPDKLDTNALTPEKEAKKKRFLEIQQAYEVLSDPAKRRSFDATRTRF